MGLKKKDSFRFAHPGFKSKLFSNFAPVCTMTNHWESFEIPQLSIRLLHKPGGEFQELKVVYPKRLP